MDRVTRYPLSWPVGWKRSKFPSQTYKYRVSFAQARDELLQELELLGASSVIISSNVPTRQDGLPHAGYSNPTDSGVAVYFYLNRKPYVFACDYWDTVKDNLREIGLYAKAFRDLANRHVGSLEQIFAGFQALPQSPNGNRPWWEVLNVKPEANLEEIKTAYRAKAKTYHPDSGGDAIAMTALNKAWEEAKKEKNQ